jgi:hypothetical protein
MSGTTCVGPEATKIRAKNPAVSHTISLILAARQIGLKDRITASGWLTNTSMEYFVKQSRVDGVVMAFTWIYSFSSASLATQAAAQFSLYLFRKDRIAW